MGSMSKKLLDKTLRIYLLFSVMVLLISAPLFYFLANQLFIDDADETLQLRKNEFVAYHLSGMKSTDVTLWNAFNRDDKIEENKAKVTRDSIFYQFHFDSLANENEPYRVLVSPFTIEKKPYVFIARINLIESDDMIKGIASLFVVILSTLLAGLYFITKYLSAHLWKPFYSTVEKVERFELDKNTQVDFALSDIEEFSRLNQSVSKLLERNTKSYNNQKEFIENASHELQTPLAIFRAKLDTLAQQLPFTDAIGQTLSDMNDSLTRLARINKNLLLLSKIENNQFAAGEEISAHEVLQKQIAFFSEQAEAMNIAIVANDITACTIRANPTLLEIAISNMLLNAVRHNKLNGRIEITLAQNKLSVANTGGISALDEKKIFQRFSLSGSNGGNGLGLAIVKKISDLHGWSVLYQYENNEHIFSLIF